MNNAPPPVTHRGAVQTESRVHERYLRHTKRFPNIWCAGCGNGIVLGAIIRAVDELGLDKNDVAMISGIGCSGRMPVYVDFNTMHTTHGRALAFATGLKMVRPWMKILVVMGDGDALAIGGNHFIHSARRNIGLTAIVINNQIYGMTGGQYSPTDTIMLHPYGRYSNAFKFAGEIDVLEVLDYIRGRLPVDPDRISVRGFSMGGAGCWQFATHYADRWFAANPGAGFAETPEFLRFFQGENVSESAPEFQKTRLEKFHADQYPDSHQA